MSELTPEEGEKIYQEEKTRIEVQTKVSPAHRSKTDKGGFIVFGSLIGIFLFFCLLRSCHSEQKSSKVENEQVIEEPTKPEVEEKPLPELIVTVGVPNYPMVIAMADWDVLVRCYSQMSQFQQYSQSCVDAQIFLKKGTKVKVKMAYEEAEVMHVEVLSGYKAGSELYMRIGTIEETKANKAALKVFEKQIKAQNSSN